MCCQRSEERQVALESDGQFRSAIMSQTTPMPEGMLHNDCVVLFDGVCNLCNGWVRFLLERDRLGKLRFAAVQSRAGQAILAWCGLPTDRFNTIVFVERGRAYTKSDAFLRIVRYLRWPWHWLRFGVVIPRPARDWLYDRVALNRFALFGRRDTCMMPTSALAARFLP